MLEDLFVFPVILVDGRNEEIKAADKDKEKLLGLSDEPEEELDIIYGEAEYPYYDFVGIEDRWEPDTASFEKALKGKFNASLVKFTNVGHLLSPWNRAKFKTELAAFIKRKEEDKKDDDPKKVTIVKFTPEMIANMMKVIDEQEDKENEE